MKYTTHPGDTTTLTYTNALGEVADHIFEINVETELDTEASYTFEVDSPEGVTRFCGCRIEWIERQRSYNA